MKIKIFFDFLTEKQLLSRYLNNYKNFSKKKVSIIRFLKRKKAKDFIISAFRWNDDVEVSWKDIDYEWSKYLKNERRVF